MSLEINLEDFATRVATEAKALRTLINGNAANLSALNTTAENNLVAAINEVLAAAQSGGSPASETVAGIAELATQTEVNTGTDDSRIVTPLKLATRLAAAYQPLNANLTSIASLSTTPYGRALLELADHSALLGEIGYAQNTAEGLIELASQTDVDTGTDPSRAVTPATLEGKLANYQATDEKGQANGYASLDGGGKIPVNQLPNAVQTYEGVWNASTNTPTLADGTGNAGQTYKVGTAGTQNLGSGNITFAVGDYAIHNGTAWEKADTTDAVTSVAGKTGIVTLEAADIESGTFLPARLPAATETAIGAVELATTTEATTGTDTTRAITAAGLKAVADTKQNLDATLTALAAIATAADKLIYATGADTFSTTDLTSFARTLLDDADAATARGTLSVYSQAQIGDPEVDLVATFEAGLV